MKIAIHHRENSFSEKWISYCEKLKISYKIVNCYDSNIVEQLEDCDALMWNHHHGNTKDILFAKGLMYSLEQADKVVFPNFYTAWHFDDKIGQKYLLESFKVSMVPTYISYDLNEALAWVNTASFPKVFKLRGGAGAANVKLAKNSKEARKFIKKAFSEGFPQFDRWNYFSEKINHYKKSGRLVDLIKGLYRLIRVPELGKKIHNQKGYVYFQDFIPNNNFDIRIVVIGNKAIGEKRFVRKNDFRASGSGEFSYDNISESAVQVAFEISKKLKLQSVAFDFIFDLNDKPLIVEMSYTFGTGGISNAPGYWDSHMNWHEGKFNLQEWMVDVVINSISQK